jgi:hypothetical protein
LIYKGGKKITNLKIPAAIIAIITITSILTALSLGALNSNQAIASSGSVTASANIAVYSDAGLTTPCSSLDWYTISPGSVTTKTIYLKNTGNQPLTLSMAPSGWSAGASGVLTLSWDKPGANLATGASTAAIFTLTAASSTGTVTSFSFNITITGTGP